MAAAIPGLNFGPEVTYILAAILIITGLALAFYGHGLWTTVMSMIGALLGSAVGFLFGAALGGIVAGLILALVGARSEERRVGKECRARRAGGRDKKEMRWRTG